MGKKSKKLNKDLNLQLSTPNEGMLEQGDGKKARKSETSEDTQDVNSVFKKKNRKRAFSDGTDADKPEKTVIGQLTNEFEEVGSTKVKSKKNKKLKLLMELDKEKTEVSNANSENCDDELHIPKKKKKNSDLVIGEEIKQEVSHDPIKIEVSEPRVQKKKKIEVDATLEGKTVNVNNGMESMSKSQKKKRTGVPVLKADESQVTEEDIDKFCNELDEEDNEQYLAWVKQIEGILPPRREKEIE